MGRYYEAELEVYNLMDELINERFGNVLGAARIKILMNNKPKIDVLTNRITFASIKCANEVERFVTMDGHNLTGIDYLILIPDPRKITDAELEEILAQTSQLERSDELQSFLETEAKDRFNHYFFTSWNVPGGNV